MNNNDLVEKLHLKHPSPNFNYWLIVGLGPGGLEFSLSEGDSGDPNQQPKPTFNH